MSLKPLARRWRLPFGTVTATWFGNALLMFIIFLTLYDGFWWTIHMWLGVSFLAGIVGFGLSYLLLPPVSPATAPWLERLTGG